MEKQDNIHYNSRKIDGYNLPYNFIISEREAGKSTFIWLNKVYKLFKEKGKSSIVIRRKIVHITNSYIEDISKIINKFTDDNIKFNYSKGSIKDGLVDIYIEDKLFIRIVGLSADITAVKSGVILNVGYIIFDEFICNPQFGEKYLKDESTKFFEVFNTYNRESKDGIKCYFLGNPYSLFNPYFLFFNVPTSKLKPGAIISDNTSYVVECYQICDELRKNILARNPLYKFDNSYTRYAFYGESVLDTNINTDKNIPNNFSLSIIVKISDKYIGIYKSNDYSLPSFYFYACFIDSNILNKRRDIYAFDFRDMVNGTSLLTSYDKLKFSMFKSAFAKRQVVFKSIEVYYLLEEIYNQI